MLLAPFSVSGCQLEASSRRVPANAAVAAPALHAPAGSHMGWLGLWALCGALAWSALALLHRCPGHSASFWLIGAPLIDLAWLLLQRLRGSRSRQRAWP